MPDEQDKVSANPYHPPGSISDKTPEPRPTLSVIEKGIGFIILGIIWIVAIVVIAYLVFLFVGHLFLLVGHAPRTHSKELVQVAVVPRAVAKP